MSVTKFIAAVIVVTLARSYWQEFSCKKNLRNKIKEMEQLLATPTNVTYSQDRDELHSRLDKLKARLSCEGYSPQLISLAVPLYADIQAHFRK